MNMRVLQIFQFYRCHNQVSEEQGDGKRARLVSVLEHGTHHLDPRAADDDCDGSESSLYRNYILQRFSDNSSYNIQPATGFPSLYILSFSPLFIYDFKTDFIQFDIKATNQKKNH